MNFCNWAGHFVELVLGFMLYCLWGFMPMKLYDEKLRGK